MKNLFIVFFLSNYFSELCYQNCFLLKLCCWRCFSEVLLLKFFCENLFFTEFLSLLEKNFFWKFFFFVLKSLWKLFYCICFCFLDPPHKRSWNLVTKHKLLVKSKEREMEQEQLRFVVASDSSADLDPGWMGGRGIAIGSSQIRHHCIQNFRSDGGRRIVIEIDHLKTALSKRWKSRPIYHLQISNYN